MGGTVEFMGVAAVGSAYPVATAPDGFGPEDEEAPEPVAAASEPAFAVRNQRVEEDELAPGALLFAPALATSFACLFWTFSSIAFFFASRSEAFETRVVAAVTSF